MKALPDIVVLDTCVLLPNVLRQAFLDLARQGCFAPAWSTVIGQEWCRNAPRLWDIAPDEVLAQWEALQQAWPAADLGEVGDYQPGLARSDPKDWHVIAAARKAKARYGEQAGVAVITRNVRDFHRAELYHLGLELLDPDQLLLRCLERCPEASKAMLDRIPAYAAAYGREPEPLSSTLKRERLFRLNKRLQASFCLDERVVAPS